ncbi:helix-turn-helix domain-containing protein, partial [Actinosynnema sp. NPDC023658]|uniref:TetR/AcrR family transcriptional regulator n=1 Tax=Actinosynnema sp. NPDC023658 TaxID=3155465 RepID=UPI0033D30002
MEIRTDARRKRDQIIDRARTLFAERGTKLPMEQIAREAGVGVGTLYRRFPDRDALIRAVLADSMRRQAELAEAELAEGRDGWQALVGFMNRSIEERTAGLLAVYGRQLVDVLKQNPELLEARQGMHQALNHIIETAQEQGTLRADIGIGDIIVIVGVLIRQHADIPDELTDAVRGRLLGLLLAGLRA